jgi:hypothetical protein
LVDSPGFEPCDGRAGLPFFGTGIEAIGDGWEAV